MSFRAAYFEFPGWESPLYISSRPGVVNLQIALAEPVYTFDARGRLVSGFVDGRNYRRSLDNRVLMKWREDGRRKRRWLSDEESQGFVESAYELARRALRAIEAGEYRVLPGPRSSADSVPFVRKALEAVAPWSWEKLQEDARWFRRVYKPVSILPPDQYMALVLQATEGCWYNKCTFCTFYRDRKFRIKSREEFRQHIAQVKEFFGPALPLKKSLFLADANALMISYRSLVEMMEEIHHEFEVMPGGLTPAEQAAWRREHPAGFKGIYSFIDAFNVGRKTVEQWHSLSEMGLHRAYIGMESGHDPLLRFLRKPGTAEDVLNAVRDLKAGGVAGGVIVLVGAGGDRYAAGHVADTIRLLNEMPLDRGDFIYFSEFVALPGAPYLDIVSRERIRPLSEEEMKAQEMAIREGYRPPDPENRPKFSVYDIREFIY